MATAMPTVRVDHKTIDLDRIRGWYPMNLENQAETLHSIVGD